MYSRDILFTFSFCGLSCKHESLGVYWSGPSHLQCFLWKSASLNSSSDNHLIVTLVVHLFWTCPWPNTECLWAVNITLPISSLLEFSYLGSCAFTRPAFSNIVNFLFYYFCENGILISGLSVFQDTEILYVPYIYMNTAKEWKWARDIQEKVTGVQEEVAGAKKLGMWEYQQISRTRKWIGGKQHEENKRIERDISEGK